MDLDLDYQNLTSVSYGLNSSEQSEAYEGDGQYEPLYEPPVYLTVFLSFCYISISVAAVVGNGLVIWVILTSRRMRNVTNYYIANLALADIAVGLFAIPFEFQAALLQRWILPHFMCPFCPFVKVLSISVSIFTLSAIALDRYRAILYPLTARASRLHFRLVISVIWLAGGVMAAPFAIALRVTKGPYPYFPENSSEIPEINYCDNVNLPVEVFNWYRTLLVLFQYFVPLVVISWAYSRVALTLWGSTAPGNAQSDRDTNIMRNKKKVIKMLVIVVVLFALCWLPLQSYNILQNITAINEYKYINIFWFGFDWLAMSNSCYNPFVYAIYNEKFKREFQMRLRAPCMKKAHRAGVEPLGRELSAFDSSRFDWKRSSTVKNGYQLKPVTVFNN